jgi:hypothetical protein
MRNIFIKFPISIFVNVACYRVSNLYHQRLSHAY